MPEYSPATGRSPLPPVIPDVLAPGGYARPVQQAREFTKAAQPDQSEWPRSFAAPHPEPVQRSKWTVRLGIAGAVCLAAWYFSRDKTWPPGMLITEAPEQKEVTGKAPWKLNDGSQVTPLASYRISARLLHRERYRWDAMSDISPVDFGVGWHEMSDQSVVDVFSFSNSNRFLSWNSSDPSAPAAAVSAANMHMLPATDRVRDRLLDLDNGDLFEAKGYLVSVERPGMNPWRSSLSRDDTGNGACEIMWVEEVREIQARPVK